ncbi:MAG: PAS domain S-box protein, partial [Planctomycetota bacterium]
MGDLRVNNLFDQLKNIEQQLRHLNLIAKEVSGGVIVTDAKGNIRFANKAIVQMHGYSEANSLKGKSIGVLHTREQMTRDVLPMIEEVKRKGAVSGSTGHLKSDGNVFPTKTKMALLKYEGNRVVGLVIFVTDLTKEKEFGKALKNKDSELAMLREQVQRQEAKIQKAEESFLKQNSELTAANEHLQQEVERCKQ